MNYMALHAFPIKVRRLRTVSDIAATVSEFVAQADSVLTTHGPITDADIPF